MSDISSKRDPTYGCENKACLYVSQRAMQGFLVVFILLLAGKKNAVFKFIFYSYLYQLMGFPHSSVVNHLPAMQETWVQFLGREDPLEKEMATHSTILAGRIPWTEEPDRLQAMGSRESDTT